MSPPANTYALITGASSGIGTEIARSLARRGYNLVITARREGPLVSLAEELSSEYGVQVKVIISDLSARDGAYALRKAVTAVRVAPEVVVLNAGVALTGSVETIAAQEERVQAMLALNVASTTLLAHSYGTDLAAQGFGRIVLISSVTASVGVRSAAAYAASKAYIRHLGRSMRADLSPKGVAMTCIFPGATDTNFAATGEMESALIFRALGARILGAVLQASDVAEVVAARIDSGRSGEVTPGVLNKAVMVTGGLIPGLGDFVGDTAFEDPPAWFPQSFLQPLPSPHS
eukprot:CAMPEP_0185747182 /NCGR_PEP_ID=MMETSP1174-20130828/5810_1 /TAXON_ID=35687 /ORGANISM="Dictyocha speculum, Strain CCMP1381" /LENGTH=288 /DNA_ID=CAMNT_0028422243 /DNA_START=101 /DNA_END=967 /DNA_ORIENTATION=-